MARRLVPVGLGLLASITLTSCTTNVGVVGLERIGEHLHAVVRTCDGRSVDQIRLVEESGPFDDTWDLPKGEDSVDIGVFDDAVTAVDTGNGFTLSARSTTSSDTITGATFTSDDLAQLNDRSVLIADPLGDYPVIFVSEEDFADLSGVC